jgi:hypothetical protein
MPTFAILFNTKDLIHAGAAEPSVFSPGHYQAALGLGPSYAASLAEHLTYTAGFGLGAGYVALAAVAHPYAGSLGDGAHYRAAAEGN